VGLTFGVVTTPHAKFNHFHHLHEGARIAQLVKAWICNLRIASSSPTAGGVFFWYGPLEGLSLQIAIVGSDHHTKKMDVPTRGLG